jgi:CheY-like chemotaxis protein
MRIVISSLKMNWAVSLMMNQAPTNGDGPIRVLVADDSKVIRRGTRQLLARQNNTIEVVGEAVSYAQIIQMASRLRPRLIVLDYTCPIINTCPPAEIESCLTQGSELLAILLRNDKSAKDSAQSLGFFPAKSDSAYNGHIVISERESW